MTPNRSVRLATIALVVAGAVVVSPAYPAGEGQPEGGRWQLSPADDLYPTYVADPRRPACSVEWVQVDRREIPDTGDTRFGLRVGGRFPIIRFRPDAAPDRGVEVAVDAGFHGSFDIDNALDTIGWDGRFGAHVGWAPPRGNVAYRFGFAHDSSHVGDEYIENTGRKRIGYTREEWVVGASAPVGRNWRTYAETGWSLILEDFQEAGRAQVGAEWRSPRRLWAGRAGWYGAIDLNAFQEDDWELDTALQWGLAVPIEDAARTWRLAATLYDGRSLLGEFFQFEERLLAVGIWLDF